MSDEKEEFVKVIVGIPDAADGMEAERMWAVALGDDVYELRNSPWFARNVNWGDWVKAIAPAEDQWPVFVSMVKRSGNRTIHIYFHAEGLAQKTDILREINKLGANYENGDGSMYAVNCPPESDVAPLTEYLRKLEADDALHFRVNSWD